MQVAPGGNHDRAHGDIAGQPAQLAERAVDPAAEFLQEEAGHAGSGINRGQDEKRLEHQRKIKPVGHEVLHAREHATESVDMPTARETAPPGRCATFTPTSADSSWIFATGNPSAASRSKPQRRC